MHTEHVCFVCRNSRGMTIRPSVGMGLLHNLAVQLYEVGVIMTQFLLYFKSKLSLQMTHKEEEILSLKLQR